MTITQLFYLDFGGKEIMKIKEYLMLVERDNDVCSDIDRKLDGEEMNNYGDLDSLLYAAQDVICNYRALVCSILDKINIEDCVKNK